MWCISSPIFRCCLAEVQLKSRQPAVRWLLLLFSTVQKLSVMGAVCVYLRAHTKGIQKIRGIF